MGAGQSNTRRLTIPNDDKNGVIKVSDAVVQRIKGCPEPEGEDELISDAPVRKPQPTQHLDNSNISSGLGLPPSTQDQQQYYQPSLTSLQILQEKEIELRKNDEYWNQRIKKLQENHREVNKVLEDEYNKASREVTKRFASNPAGKNACPPCQDIKSNVLDCYINNPKSTLACASIVKEFAACVDSTRVNIQQTG